MTNRRVSVIIAVIAATAAIAVWFSSPTNICGEAETVQQKANVSQYLPDNSGVQSRGIRTLAMDQSGLWIGYAGSGGVGIADNAGVSHFDGKLWRFCRQTPHVNAIAIDRNGRPWVGTDAPPRQNALLHFDGKEWRDYTSSLPDHRVYGLTFFQNNLYVATWEGVGQFDGRQWTLSYSTTQGTLSNSNHIHAIAFTHDEVWFGTIDRGVIRLTSNGLLQEVSSPELNLSASVLQLGSDKIRRITISPSGDQVWFAADGGDLTVYDYSDAWTRHAIPDNRVNDVQFDGLGRPWIATKGGVFYFDNDIWNSASQYPAYAVAFGCNGCTLPTSQYFIGTISDGLVWGYVPK